MKKFIANVICSFVPNRDMRHKIRRSIINEIHIALCGSSDQIPYAAVTIQSIMERTKRSVRFYFLYAYPERIGGEAALIDAILRVNKMVAKYKNVRVEFYNVQDKLYLFKGQDMGWFKDYGNYMRLLLPIVLPANIRKVIYMDTDMAMTCDAGEIWDIDLTGKSSAFAFEYGHFARGKNPNDLSMENVTVFNSGFIIMNLEKWRAEGTFEKILKHYLAGQVANKRGGCADNALLCSWFLDFHRDDLKIIAPEYNAMSFHVRSKDKAKWNPKVIHYCGLLGKHDLWKNEYSVSPPQIVDNKPWKTANYLFAHDIWWDAARKTPFYEKFIDDLANQKLTKFVPKSTAPIPQYNISGTGNKIIIVDNGVEKELKNQIINGLNININGNNNTIKVASGTNFINSNILLESNGCNIVIGHTKYRLSGLSIRTCGGHNQKFALGEDCRINSCDVYLNEENAECRIGDDRLLSSQISIWPSDGHTVFDKDSGVIINNIKGPLSIGNHCWIGQGVRLAKNCRIPNHTIIGIGAVVTREFTQEYTAIAGNPGKVIKTNVDWDRKTAAQNQSGFNKL